MLGHSELEDIQQGFVREVTMALCA
jgi:hypothetical protein